MRIKMTNKWHGGKGSTQRPVDKQKFDANWDEIFGKHKKDQERYAEQLRTRGVEPPNKKHYGEDGD